MPTRAGVVFTGLPLSLWAVECICGSTQMCSQFHGMLATQTHTTPASGCSMQCFESHWDRIWIGHPSLVPAKSCTALSTWNSFTQQDVISFPFCHDAPTNQSHTVLAFRITHHQWVPAKQSIRKSFQRFMFKERWVSLLRRSLVRFESSLRLRHYLRKVIVDFLFAKYYNTIVRCVSTVML